MDHQTVKEINKRVDDLYDFMLKIEKIVSKLNLHASEFVKGNKPIPPAIFPKIAYDSKGLVVNGMPLGVDDIPDLPIEKINGLKKSLSKNQSNDEIQVIKDLLIEKLDKNKEIKPGIGTKFQFDENGLIVSSLGLSASDIPQLTVNQIDGLDDRLGILESAAKVEAVETHKVSPGTFTKITYDSNGRVVRGDSLVEGDIPSAVLKRISWLEGQVPFMASQTLLENTISETRKMVIGNDPITSGTYTKVTVDSKGLVTKGTKLSMSDLPTITIEDVAELQTALLKKVDRADLISLQKQLSVLQNNNQSSEIAELRNQLIKKLNIDDLNTVTNAIFRLQTDFESLSKRVPHEMASKQMKQVMDDLSTLISRVQIIEQKLGIEKQGEA